MHNPLDLFNYHIHWKSTGHHPGQHKSGQRGMGIEFTGHSNLLDYPDPRRIDIRQTIRDPLEQVHVRIFNQRSATPVMIMADLSSSMGYGHKKSKFQISSEIAEIITNSVIAKSDALGFIGFNDKISSQWVAPLSYRPYQTKLLIEKLKNYKSEGESHSGLKRVVESLPKDRTLVFLISDFHMPIKDIEESLASLVRHQVVPIILWNKSEFDNLPKFGLLNVEDAETCIESTIFLREKITKKIKADFKIRKGILQQTFLKYNTPPFFVEDNFKSLEMSNYFNEFFCA
ncbi:MAG: hypothetical protein HOF49_01810 [Nitrosomonadales bacterium]|jgi:uncharacterized protein (DUF58 family)|nr:hypothetical protein [Nitrosomonadales bacterium]MBT4182791.1 hypothetical protein [Nitrosomonadales bacterium]MBT7121134.1 hypothetical protein [Nitrosomonadales bacterium]MBT7406987.1 hypothetical protein [Nitrosomonadales bacterium]